MRVVDMFELYNFNIMSCPVYQLSHHRNLVPFRYLRSHTTNQQSHRQLSLTQSIICQSVVRQSSCSFLKVINVLWDWKPNIKRSHLNISQIQLSLPGSLIEIWFWAKGYLLCKQCLHDLQFMKKGSSSPNLSKLARADISCEFMKTRSLCRTVYRMNRL